MKNPSPYFSIVIPTLNEEKYLPFLLNDLTKQTNQDFEVIIIDGNSKDKTVQSAQMFKQKLNLKTYRSIKKNVCFQRNLGASKARSSWLLFMDADNRLPSYFIQGLRYRIDHHNPDVFITYVSPDGDHQLDKAIAQVINTFFQLQQNIKKPYLLESMLGIKKALFVSIGGFNEKIVWSEGGELLVRLRKKHIAVTTFKDPKYTYSFRRNRKEGTLKALRNSAFLILAQQTGVKLDLKTYKKYYPMLGGSFFDKTTSKNNSLENIFQTLLEKYEVSKLIKKLNTPIKSPKNPLKKFIRKLF